MAALFFKGLSNSEVDPRAGKLVASVISKRGGGDVEYESWQAMKKCDKDQISQLIDVVDSPAWGITERFYCMPEDVFLTGLMQ